MRARATAAALALLALAAACRDGDDPFVAADRPGEPPRGSWRLTYSPLEDRAPRWAGPDSLYYAAEVPDPLPRTVSTLQTVPRDGGAARPLLGALQDPTATRRWLIAPVPSPDRRRLAYVEVWAHLNRDLCVPPGTPMTATVCDPADWTRIVPTLAQVRIRVREVDAVGPLEQDPEARVVFDHAEMDTTRHPLGLPGVHVFRDHPFHVLSRDEGAFFFRPSWSPDGERLVFSDGLSLAVWEPGGGAATVIPGTDEGIWPAWSPLGDRIAYTRLERADSTLVRCTQYTVAEGEQNALCALEQTLYTPGRRVLTLVAPDGSDAVELAEGSEPAWSPDGREVFFARTDGLWRIRTDGTGERAVPGTQGGREPAVSPDGGHVAFVRPTVGGGRDVWVVEIEP